MNSPGEILKTAKGNLVAVQLQTPLSRTCLRFLTNSPNALIPKKGGQRLKNKNIPPVVH
jgi:hypothetical protein